MCQEVKFWIIAVSLEVTGILYGTYKNYEDYHKPHNH